MSDLSKIDYLNISPTKIKNFLVDNLKKSSVFTDQIYEASNISSIVDLHSAFTNLMLYYLSQSSNQKDFSETKIYENINRIVKILDYKPIGSQTSVVNFRLFAKNLARNHYIIPRYYYVDLGGIRYSLNEDLFFSKEQDDTLEEILNIENNKLLYQGQYIEYPTITAVGAENEEILLSVNDDVIVDHFNIDVYVKKDNKWHKFTKVDSLYLSKDTDFHYEIRLNENKLYEIKFGDGYNGIKLNSGDSVGIYYLKSNGTKGEIATGVLNGRKLNSFNTTRFSEILNDVICYENKFVGGCNIVGTGATIYLQNDCPSTPYRLPESVDEIRKNAPKASHNGQYQLIKKEQFEVFIKSNFSNVIHDVKVLNNEDFLNKYFKHYESLGLNDPKKENRVLYNSLKFGNSCNFNNIYGFIVPKSALFNEVYLNSALKELIINSINKEKCLTSNFIPFDPIYLNLRVGYDLENIDNTILQIEKDNSVIINENVLKKKVYDAIISFFKKSNYGLGATINNFDLLNSILNISGVKGVKTINNVNSNYIEGINIIAVDKVFDKISVAEFNNKIVLDDIFFPLFEDNDLLNKIVIV